MISDPAPLAADWGVFVEGKPTGVPLLTSVNLLTPSPRMDTLTKREAPKRRFVRGLQRESP